MASAPQRKSKRVGQMAAKSKISPDTGDIKSMKDENEIVTADVATEVTRCFFPHLESEEECRNLNTYGITVRSQKGMFEDYQLLVSYQSFCKLRKDLGKMLDKSSSGGDSKGIDSFPQLSGRWFTWFDRDPVQRQPVLNEWLRDIVKSRKQGTGWTSDARRKLNHFLLMGEFTDNTRQRGSRRRSIFDEPEQAKSGVSGHDNIAGGFHRSVQLPRVYCCAISQDGDYMAVATDSDGNSAVVDRDAATIKIFALKSRNGANKFWKRDDIVSLSLAKGGEGGGRTTRHKIVQIALRRLQHSRLQLITGVAASHSADTAETLPGVIIDELDTVIGEWKRWDHIKYNLGALPSSSRFFAFPACSNSENIYFAAWPANGGAGLVVSKISGKKEGAEASRLLFKNVHISQGEKHEILPNGTSCDSDQTMLPRTPEDDEVSRLTNVPNVTGEDLSPGDYFMERGACDIAEDNRKIDGDLRVAAITGSSAEDNEVRVWAVHDPPSNTHSRRHMSSQDADDDLVGGRDDTQWSYYSSLCGNKRKQAWGRLLPPKHGSSTTSYFVAPIKLSRNYLIAGAKESRKRSDVPDLGSKTYDRYVLVVWDIVKHAQIFCFQHPGTHPSASPRLDDFAYNLKLASAQVIACALDDGISASEGAADGNCPRLLTVVKCRPHEFHKAHLSAQHKAIGGLQTQDWAAADQSAGVKSAEYEKDKHLCAIIMQDAETFAQTLDSFSGTASNQLQQRAPKARQHHLERRGTKSNTGTKTSNDSFLIFVRDLRDGMIQRVFHHPHRVRLAALGGIHVVTVDDAASQPTPSNVDVRELSGPSMMMTLNVTNEGTQSGSNKPLPQNGRSRAETLTPGAVDRQMESASPANFGGRASRDFDDSTSASQEDKSHCDRDLWMPLLRVSPNGKRVVLSSGKGHHTGRVHVHSIEPTSDITDSDCKSGPNGTRQSFICVIPPEKTEIKKELVTGCAFDREGKHLATCSYQGEIKWWTIPSSEDEPLQGKILWPPKGKNAPSWIKSMPLCTCDVSPDGKRVVAVEMGERDEGLSEEQEGKLPPTRRAIVINLINSHCNVIFWHDDCPLQSIRRLTHIALSGQTHWLGPKGPTVDDVQCVPARYWAVTGTSNGTICVWDATAAGEQSSGMNGSTDSVQSARIEHEDQETELQVTAKDLSLEEDVLYGKFHDLQSIDAVAARSDVELPHAYRNLLMSQRIDLPGIRDMMSRNPLRAKSPQPQSATDATTEPQGLKMGTLVAFSGEARDGTGALVIVRHLGQASNPKENHGEPIVRERPLVAIRCDSRVTSLHVSHDGRYIAICGQNAPLIVHDFSACIGAAAHHEGDVKVADLKPLMQEPPVIYVGDWNSTPLCDMPSDPSVNTKYELHSHNDPCVKYDMRSHVSPLVFFSRDSASSEHTRHDSSTSNTWSMKLRVVDMERVVQYGPSVGRASRLLGFQQKGGNRQSRLRILRDLVRRFPQLPNKMNSYAAVTGIDAKLGHLTDDSKIDGTDGTAIVKATTATQTLVDLALKHLDIEALEILLSSPEVQLHERYFITAVRQRMLEAVMLLLRASEKVPAAGRIGVVRSFPLLLRHFPDDLATWLSTLHFDVSETNVKRAVMDEPEMQLRRFAPGTLDAKHQWDSTFPDRTFNKRDGFALDAQHVAWPGIASSKVLQAFTDCDNADIFSNDVIKTVVEVVWVRRAWPIMQIEVAKYFAYLAVWTLYAFNNLWAENQLNADVCDRPAFTWNLVLEVLVMCFSLGYIIREVKQMRRKQRPELDSTNAIEELPAWARSGATTGKLPLCCQYPVRTILKFPLVTWIDWQYFQDIWNWIQLTCFVLQFYCVVLHIAERQRLCDKDVLSCDLQVECYLALKIGALASILAYFNLLFYGRGFPSLSPIIRMVLAIVSDIRYFALVLGLLVFTFTQAFILLHAPNGVHASFSFAHDGVELPFGKWSSSLIHTFNMMLGEFDMEWFDYSVSRPFTQFVFIIYMFIVSIVLLNLLIAIMADSYSRVQSKARSEGLSQKAKIMLEMLALQSSQENERYEKEVTWVHLLKPRHRQLHSEQDWQGQINAVETHIRHALEKSQEGIVRNIGSQIRQLRTAVYNLQQDTVDFEHSEADNLKNQNLQKSRKTGADTQHRKRGNDGSVGPVGNGPGDSTGGDVLHTPSPQRGPGRWSGHESDPVYVMLRRKPNGTPTRTPAGSPGPLFTQQRPKL